MDKNIKRPAAPPAYRPQPTQKVLQRKEAAAQPPRAFSRQRTPAAPPAYRPQPTPKVLQPKSAQAKAVNGHAQAAGPSQARPKAAAGHSAVQPKMPGAPSPGVVQLTGNKCKACGHNHGASTCTFTVYNSSGRGIRKCGCKSYASPPSEREAAAASAVAEAVAAASAAAAVAAAAA